MENETLAKRVDDETNRKSEHADQDRICEVGTIRCLVVTRRMEGVLRLIGSRL